MAYRFVSGTNDYVRFAVAPLNGAPFGPFTWAFLLKHNVTAATAAILALTDSSDTLRTYSRFGSADQLQTVSPVNTGPTLTGTTIWYLAAVTVSGSTGVPRFHVHDGTSWTHTNGASGYSTLTVASSDRLYIGSGGVGVLPLSADVVCAGIKKTAATDLQVETLSRTLFSAWRSFGFDWLVGFDSSLVTGGLLQDQGALGTGDETARSGTTQVSDPPGWVWTSVAPAANFTGTPLTGTEPLAVTFTDSSTNTPTSWAWDFGDGGTSTAQNPTHTYTTAGTYTVALTATNATGSNTLTRTGYVTVSDQPRPIRINTSQGWRDIGDDTSFVSGSGTPTAAVGATGAIYLNTATGLHYGPKAAGAWPGTALPVPAGTPADATTSSKGVVQLAGDLTGTAALPRLKVPYGTSLPASPADGQEAILVDSTTNPSYQWRFRFNAGSSSAYKWEFVGGSPIRAELTTAVSPIASAWTAIACQVQLPRAGDYLLSYGTRLFIATGTVTGFCGPMSLAGNPPGASWVAAVIGNGGYQTMSRSGYLWTISPADEIHLMVYGGAASTSFENNFLAAQPVRVS